jgi:tetratricopeptide (TPR) repeat protein
VKLNRTQLIISGILLMLALGLAIYFSRAPGSLVPAEGGPGSSIRDLVTQPVNLKAAIAKEGSQLPAVCPALWERLAKAKVEDFEKFTDEDRMALQTCSEALPILAKHDPKHLQRLQHSCIIPDAEDSNAMQSNCALYYFLYKAGLVSWFNKGKAVKDLHTEELALIFFHEYNNLNPGQLDALATLADLMVQRTGSYSALKAKASIQLFQFMYQKGSVKPEDLRRTLTELSERNPHDEQLLELHFVALAVLNDVSKMNELTESFVAAHPSSAAGFFVRSAYFWQIKDQNKTLDALKNAIALEPTNRRYSETRERAEQALPGSPGVYDLQASYDLLSE